MPKLQLGHARLRSSASFCGDNARSFGAFELAPKRGSGASKTGVPKLELGNQKNGRDVKDWAFAVSVGAALLVTGATMMRSHWLAWLSEKNDPSLDENDRTYYCRRFRRRMQTSAMIAVLGLLIPFGDAILPQLFDDEQRQMVVFGIYWGAVLLLTVWVIIMGLGDFFASSAHTRGALARIRLKQRELERQLEEARRRNTNGHQKPN